MFICEDQLYFVETPDGDPPSEPASILNNFFTQSPMKTRSNHLKIL